MMINYSTLDHHGTNLKGAFTYDVSRRGGFKMLTRGGGGLSLADVSKNI